MKHNKNNGSNVPNLRFPEFTGAWSEGKVSDACYISTGNKNTQDKEHDGLYPFFVRSQTIERINSYSFDGEAVLTAGDGVGVGKVFHYSTGKIGVHQRVYILSNFICDSKYLYYFFSSKFYDRVKRMSAKNSVDSVRMDMIANMPLSLPAIDEQKKIASLLSLIDERIATQNKIIEKLESSIKGLNTISQKDTWRLQFLKDLLNERKEQNTNGYTVFSVAVKEGLIDQVKHLGRSFSAKDTSDYNVVKFGDLVYTKSPTGNFPYGIVKQSHVAYPVAVSPLYGVYQPKNIHIGNILHNYFSNPINTNNYLHSLIQKGAKNTINISSSRFLDKGVPLPSDDTEIENLSRLITSMRQKIDLERDVLNQFNNQKCFLLKEMFI